MCIETGEIFDCIIFAAEKCGVNKSNIVQVCKGKRQKAGGYSWQYVCAGGVSNENDS
jgi:hypothetical protein